ncbi:MAG: alpha/beta fold hydrolase [Deltaproteobacteria bacterium]|nr:MAG: alpha/beta fold hydrolase [Deltaproteobacteria bacterium]
MLRFALAVGLASLATPAFAGTVSIKSADGTSLKAQHQGAGEKGVVLVHGKNRSAQDFEYLRGRLASQGFQVLALDLRGHGASGSNPSDEAWAEMDRDVCAAAEYLGKRGSKVTTVVGAEFGGATTIHAAADCDAIHRLVLLSPDLSKSGDVTVGASLEAMGEKPMLVIYDPEEMSQNRSAGFIEAKAQGKVDVTIAAGAGAGVKMLNRDAGIEGTILSWLNASYELNTADLTKGRTIDSAGEASDIETSGVEYGTKND